MAYLSLFTWSFLAATLVPVGSELALVVLVRQGYPLPSLVLVATIGNYLGACTTYWLARAAARAWTFHGGSTHGGSRPRGGARPPGSERATSWLNTYGQPALLLSWVPIIGDAIVAVAGAARMPFVPFSAWTIAGKLARYIVVGWGASAW